MKKNNLKSFLSCWVVSTILLIIPSQGWAQELSWDQLAPEEKKLLVPFKEHWKQLNEKKRQQLKSGAQRYQKMNPDQRNDFKQKFQSWK